MKVYGQGGSPHAMVQVKEALEVLPNRGELMDSQANIQVGEGQASICILLIVLYMLGRQWMVIVLEVFQDCNIQTF